MTTAVFRGTKVELTLDKVDVFDYLLGLRYSGVTNMWGASSYITRQFNCSQEEASYWLMIWMDSFK